MNEAIDIILKDLEDQPSKTHNLFKRVLLKVYEQKDKDLNRFIDECAAYLVSITAQAQGIITLEGLDKKHVKRLIEMLELEISTMDNFWEKMPESKKQCPESVKEYKLDKNILIRLKQK